MKKINECFDKDVDSDIVEYIFGNVSLTETDNVDNPEYKNALECAFGSVTNCKKNFTYIDQDHWVFTID